MLKYLLRKTLTWLIVIFLATNVAYLLAATFLDPRSNYAGRRPPLSSDQIDRILTPLNLNPETPLLERWWTWLSGILFHWNWGTSPLGDPVNAQISYRIWVSAQLLLMATLLAVVIGVGLGVYTASRQYKASDRLWQGGFHCHDEYSRGRGIAVGGRLGPQDQRVDRDARLLRHWRSIVVTG